MTLVPWGVVTALPGVVMMFFSALMRR
jgi:hypothetical protein